MLRITGGEPFLLPELVLECLEEIKELGLDKEIFVWTETDLFPFIKENGKSFIEALRIERSGKTIDLLSELSKYKNFAIHPCLHGLSNDNIKEITQQNDLTLDMLLDALRVMVLTGLDIYPTFGSNMSEPADLIILFQKLYGINTYLPLRFALIEYNLEYVDITKRLMEEEKNRGCHLYSKYTNLRIWNDLLKAHYKVGYAVIPRHFIKLTGSGCDNSVISADHFLSSDKYRPRTPILYIFKSSFRENYHREILDMLALPEGTIYKLEYDKKWVQLDLFEHIKMRPVQYKNTEVLLLYIDLDSKDKKVFPLRKMNLEFTRADGNVISIYLKLGGYAEPIDLKKVNLRNKLEDLFGRNTIAGTPTNKLLLIGEKVDELNNIKYNDTFAAWRQVVNQLYDNYCKKFEKSIFYKLQVDKEVIASQDEIPPNEKTSTADDTAPRSIYEITGGNKFSIHVEYYQPNCDKLPKTDSGMRTIVYETSSDILNPLATKQFIVSKYGSETLNFSTEVVYETQECNIHFQCPSMPFEAPMIDLQVVVKGSGDKIRATKTFGIAATGFGGGILATTSLTSLTFFSQTQYVPLLILGSFGLLILGAHLSMKYEK